MATPSQLAGGMAALVGLMLLGGFITHEASDQQATEEMQRDIRRNRDLLEELAAERGATHSASVSGTHGVAAPVAPRGAAVVAAASAPPSSSATPALPRRRLFVIINSYVGAEARRRAARATWVRTLKNTYQADADGNLAIEAKFFVGSVPDKKQMDKIYVEQRTFQDLIVIDFHDGYSTLGEKVPLLYRETISRVNATYVMKVDDDTWVNVGVLPSVLARMKPTRTYMGLMMEGMEVLRGAHKNAENKLPQSMKHFPPYASGCFTIISADLAHLLAKPPIVPIKMVNDDAFFGILFFPFQVERVSEKRIHPWGVDRCTPAEAIVGIHYVPPTCFPKLSHNVSQGFPICNSKIGCA
eukprot:m.428767 g.428767  ORF g.428767 m.428767 type:complete len:356 (+) comp16875_c0_seq1:834-1901(+)